MATQPKFDPNAEYKAACNFRYAGRAILKGQWIDKSLSDAKAVERIYDAHKIVPMTDEEVEDSVIVTPGLTDDQRERADQLIAQNDRAALDAMAAGEPYKIASPEALPNKAAVAEAIVRAEAGAA